MSLKVFDKVLVEIPNIRPYFLAVCVGFTSYFLAVCMGFTPYVLAIRLGFAERVVCPCDPLGLR
jgi:hypothetical protein